MRVSSIYAHHMALDVVFDHLDLIELNSREDLATLLRLQLLLVRLLLADACTR